ncbi:MAG: hypothetical protein U9R60_06805 [Bacteroidota bacterium]|nr:hypothetical protein [Bacteroidota bacterium]
MEIHKELIEKSKEGNSKAQYKLYELYAKLRNIMTGISTQMLSSSLSQEWK